MEDLFWSFEVQPGIALCIAPMSSEMHNPESCQDDTSPFGYFIFLAYDSDPNEYRVLAKVSDEESALELANIFSAAQSYPNPNFSRRKAA